MSFAETKINDLFQRLQEQRENATSSQMSGGSSNLSRSQNMTPRPRDLGNLNSSPQMRRPGDLPIRQRPPDTEIDKRFKEIMQSSGKLKINDVVYSTDIKEMEYIEELGSGTCGQVVKMRHKPSDEIIAVKQMRRSLNTEENKRIVMDIDVVIKSSDCKYIVQCLGIFLTDTEVWICMELMSTCFDKLLKRLQHPIPEFVLGHVTCATVRALSYLKDVHGVIHRDVKPSNILVDVHGVIHFGNVKLCDFGISGRLVDSRAKTRSAGCAAYMAPERIEITNPDYDIRADVWSLGITLVELATGALPYQDCKTDFEVLARVIGNDPPTLPENKDFTPEFREFVSLCLIKDKNKRPKYHELQDSLFIRKYERLTSNEAREWFIEAIRQAENLAANRSTPRHTPSPSLKRQTVTTIKPPIHHSVQQSMTNGSSSLSVSPNKQYLDMGHPDMRMKPSLPPDGRNNHVSRISTFQNTNLIHQRDHLHQSIPDKPYHQSKMECPIRSYSPLQSYQSHMNAKNSTSQDRALIKSPLFQRRNDISSDNSPFTSPILTRKIDYQPGLSSPFFAKKSENRLGSPLDSSSIGYRSPYQNEEQQQPYYESSSPIVRQRFEHQQKQQQQAREAEEAAKLDSGKKRFASYMKLQLGGDKSGRSSRHQSPEPPPRLNRGLSGDQSPLAIRRNYIDNSTPGSPSLSRRYISPTPPIPPPRRLSESTSVPGSPQHLRARFHYTPEPQRRLFHQNDIS
ncbi:Protein kinase domain [Popillia japonica]|uniref:mitogen-activated protein kinase kinase n=1 Tax=Popillia japonica TaxID=7064 RepID=A0AAW1LA21_POPJA